MSQLDVVLERMLHGPAPQPLRDLAEWWPRERELRAEFSEPAARALVMAQESARLGLAFAGGFRAALVRLTGQLDPTGERRLAFCATERTGAHPRSIATTLESEGAGYRIRGEKTWTTLGESADELLVVCRRGERADGRPALALARVLTSDPGVTPTAARPTPFCPEITHSGFTFDLVLDPERVLPGDGYADYLRPFRTVEDCHIQLVVCAYLLGVARRNQLGAEWQEAWCGSMLGAWTVAALDPGSSATHTALAGLESQVAQQIERFEVPWRERAGDEWDCWERDRGLLRVAGQAREARRERSRELLG